MRSSAAHNIPAPESARPELVAALVHVTALVHSAVRDASMWQAIRAKIGSTAELIEEQDVLSLNALTEVLVPCSQDFPPDSPLRMDSAALAAIVPQGDIYFKLASLLPFAVGRTPHPVEEDATPDRRLQLICGILECNLLQAMENRLRLVHASLSSAHLRSCVENFGRAVLTFNHGGECVFANTRALELLGVGRNEDVTRSGPFARVLRRIARTCPASNLPNGAKWLQPQTTTVNRREHSLYRLVANDYEDGTAISLMHVFIEPKGLDVTLVELAADFARLSPREGEILQRIVNGFSKAKIAAELGIGSETVKTHISRIFAKFGVSNRTDLLKKVLTVRPGTQS